jgi:hypothetical protein
LASSSGALLLALKGKMTSPLARTLAASTRWVAKCPMD